MLAYLEWLKQYADKFDVHIHAWVLMTNHVHLLCTLYSEHGVSKMMQSIGRSYVYYFNKRYGRSGTLWEGRFKSALVDTDNYLFSLYRYIEMNPVAANMVSHPTEYHWSSYHPNALDLVSQLIKPHNDYFALGGDVQARLTAYTEMFASSLPSSVNRTIKVATDSSLAIGSEKFVAQIELLSGQNFRPRKPGRPTN